MNISKISNIYETYTVSSSNKIDKKITNNIQASYTPSGTATDFANALNAIKNTPEVRIDKVASIKNEIEAGTYLTSSNDIANKILSSIFVGGN